MISIRTRIEYSNMYNCLTENNLVEKMFSLSFEL